MSSSKRLGMLAQGIKGAKQKHATPSKRQGLKLEQISDRPHGDTRPLNPQHVEELADSIAAVGLIQPLAVDNEGHLLAGGHRRAALEMLALEQADKFAELFPKGLVPTRVFEFSAATEPDRAIAIEAAENEKRRDYTPTEVRALAERLVEAGYRSTKGKPKKGQKALQPALMVIVGKSRATVQRYLAGDNKAASNKASHEALSEKDKQEKLEAQALKILEKLELSELTSDTVTALAARLREEIKG